MSTGLVVCSECKREVHQNGPRNHGARCRCPTDAGWCPSTWLHCDDQTPRCAGASAVFPAQRNEIVGAYCGLDD